MDRREWDVFLRSKWHGLSWTCFCRLDGSTVTCGGQARIGNLESCLRGRSGLFGDLVHHMMHGNVLLSGKQGSSRL
eukprot:scaffold1926_cov305-Prasinococcus_capsulatus_cf.AAC.1